jgi:hypothetical protein
MSMSNDDHFKFFGVDFVEKRQTVSIFLIDHESAVQHDLLVVDGEDEAGAADLASSA